MSVTVATGNDTGLPDATVIATDSVGGAEHQLVKLEFGATGAATLVSASDPLPVTASSLPLPTGAATAAKQPALGTAGTPSADVITVQGSTNAKALHSTITSPNAQALGIFGTITGYGYQRVSDEPTAIFYDPLDSLDTTDRWTTKLSTGTAAVTNGVLTCASSTTASAYGGVFSQATFSNRGLNFVSVGVAAAFNTVTIANSTRWIGWGTIQATPTTAVPITNGAGFLLDGSGNLYGKVYAAAAEVGSVDLTAYKPADGVYTRFSIVYRADQVLFYIGTIEYPVGSLSYTNPAIQTLPISIISIAGATPPASTAQIRIQSIGAGDTGKNNSSIVDPAFPWRGATVKKASTAAAATDLPLVVALHPTSPTPALTASTNLIGDVGIQARANATGAATIKHFVSAATTNTANVKASAGRVLGWCLANTTAAWKYVKLHNTTGTPTAGAAVVQTIGIPPNGMAQMSIPQGLAFATGIGMSAVTGAADSDATATAANDIVGDIFYA